MRAHRHPYNQQTLHRPHVFSEMPNVELVVTRGRARRRRRPVIGPVFLIGASTHCDLVLGDPQFPAVHAYLLVTVWGVRLRHLGAPPEIWIDDQQVDVAALEDRDRIDTGPFQFEVQISGQAETSARLPRIHRRTDSSRTKSDVRVPMAGIVPSDHSFGGRFPPSFPPETRPVSSP